MLILNSRCVFKDGSQKGFIGSLFDVPAGSEENKSCVSLFNSMNMKRVLKLSLLSTLSPRYLADMTFSKVPFKDDVQGRNKFLFVGDTNALTRQRMEPHQPSLFPFLKGFDVALKLDSVSGRCLLSTQSFAKSILLECLTEAGKSLMNTRKSSGPQWHFLWECQKWPNVTLT